MVVLQAGCTPDDDTTRQGICNAANDNEIRPEGFLNRQDVVRSSPGEDVKVASLAMTGKKLPLTLNREVRRYAGDPSLPEARYAKAP